jgi:hypothetical protein
VSFARDFVDDACRTAGGFAGAESTFPFDLVSCRAVARAWPVINVDNSVEEFSIEVAE